LGYAVGAADLCAAGVGAPHIRQRLYWVAVSESWERDINGQAGEQGWDLLDSWTESIRPGNEKNVRGGVGAGSEDGGVGDSESNGRESRGAEPGRPKCAPGSCEPGALANTTNYGTGGTGSSEQGRDNGIPGENGGETDCGLPNAVREGPPAIPEEQAGTGPGDCEFDWNGPCQWWPCRDGKYRRIPAESGIFGVDARIPEDLVDNWTYRAVESSFPLSPKEAFKGSRVGLLRGYGNSICVPLAVQFIMSVMEVLNEEPL
jgi:DNA (cytosine-5)-methyltransferase 1